MRLRVLRIHAVGFREGRPQQDREEGGGFGHFLDRSDSEHRNPGAHIDELESVADVVEVEVYPGLSQPAEFQRGNPCGMIELWTGE